MHHDVFAVHAMGDCHHLSPLRSAASIHGSRVDHDSDAVLRVKEDIGAPLTNTGDALIDLSRVQRFEDRSSAKHTAHGLFLVFRILPCHFFFPPLDSPIKILMFIQAPHPAPSSD